MALKRRVQDRGKKKTKTSLSQYLRRRMDLRCLINNSYLNMYKNEFKYGYSNALKYKKNPKNILYMLEKVSVNFIPILLFLNPILAIVIIWFMKGRFYVSHFQLYILCTFVLLVIFWELRAEEEKKFQMYRRLCVLKTFSEGQAFRELNDKYESLEKELIEKNKELKKEENKKNKELSCEVKKLNEEIEKIFERRNDLLRIKGEYEVIDLRDRQSVIRKKVMRKFKDTSIEEAKQTYNDWSAGAKVMDATRKEPIEFIAKQLTFVNSIKIWNLLIGGGIIALIVHKYVYPFIYTYPITIYVICAIVAFGVMKAYYFNLNLKCLKVCEKYTSELALHIATQY